MTILSTTGTFTFQSGSIQIVINCYIFRFFLFFTFQSGSIQMFVYYYMLIDLKTLHSNLVLFKSFSGQLIYRSERVFTFQSGSIQIC